MNTEDFMLEEPSEWGYLDEHKNVIRFKNFKAFIDAHRDPDFHKKHRSLESRVVGQEQVGDDWVSTVFLGLDHGWGGKEKWFETMVFPRPGGVFPKVTINGVERDSLSETYTQRYTTYYEAVIGHTLVVKRLQESKAPDAPVEVPMDDDQGYEEDCINNRAQSA